MCLIFKCFRRYRDLQSQKENTAVFCFALDFFFKFVLLNISYVDRTGQMSILVILATRLYCIIWLDLILNHLTTMTFISRMTFFSCLVDPLMYRLLSMTFRATPVLVSILLNLSRPFPITWPINLSGITMSSFLNPPWLELRSSRALCKATH